MGSSNENSKSRLAQAMQDAAISNINEDIHDILVSLEKITQEIPAKVKAHMGPLKEDIDALNQGLKSVPVQFDQDYGRKMNRVLDVISEVEMHTKKLNHTLQSGYSNNISKTADQLAHEFNQKLEGYSVTSNLQLIFFGVVCACMGGIISALSVWVIFPQLF